MLTINLNSDLKTPLYEQIYNYIKEEIKNGNIVYNTKLPSSRGLASYLSVSRNTVDMAYAQLLSEGYIDAYPKKGYFVNKFTQLNKLNNPKAIKSNIKKYEETLKYKYDFSPFAINLEKFPYNTWRQLSKNCLINDNNNLFLLGNSQGDYQLREVIVKYLYESRGVNCKPEQIIIGAGVDYILQLLAQIFTNKTKIAIENPAYKQAYNIFTGFSINTYPIAIDKLGIDIKSLYKTDAEIVYVTPSHQYPIGIVMPIKRRLELLEWANQNENRYIIEDDHDSEFRYKGKPIPALQGLDENDKVIYLGTFSRAIAPAIRVAYVVMPQALLNTYINRFSYYSCTVSRLDQAIITDFIKYGYFERHLNKMRKIYKNKHDLLINNLNISKSSIIGENAGLHIVLKLNTNLEENEVIKMGANFGLKLYGLKEHYIEIPKNYKTSLLFGYANLSDNDIIEGIKIFNDNILSKI